MRCQLVLSRPFNSVCTMLVAFNMLLMCLPYASMTHTYARTIELCATMLSLCFILEMAIKITALGWNCYWSDSWNSLDGSLAAIAALELLLSSPFFNFHFSFLRLLRTLRVVRALRLLRAWKGLYRVVFTFFKSLPRMHHVLALMLLCAFVFALVGMQARKKPR